METLKLKSIAPNLVFGRNAIALDFSRESDAIAALKLYELHFADWARRWGCEALEVRIKGKKHTKVSADLMPEMFGLSALPELPEDEDKPVIDTNQSPQHLSSILFGADYGRLWEFCLEQYHSGRIIIITENHSNICLHTNDRLTKKRASWNPKDFNGYDYLKSWRSERNGTAEDGVNPQYWALRDFLDRDHYVPNYKYTLYRPDGALCEYSTDYYLCNDYQGTQVRIGVSDPDAYEILAPA